MICGRCGRKLKDPASIRIGYGPVCRAELGIEVEGKPDKNSGRSSWGAADTDKEFVIPGQTSVFDHPEWLPDDFDLEEERHG